MSNRSIPSPSAQADASESDDFLLSARQSAQLLGVLARRYQAVDPAAPTAGVQGREITRYRRKDVLGLAKARP